LGGLFHALKVGAFLSVILRYLSCGSGRPHLLVPRHNTKAGCCHLSDKMRLHREDSCYILLGSGWPLSSATHCRGWLLPPTSIRRPIWYVAVGSGQPPSPKA